VYGVIQDITARKLAEAALAASHRQLVEVSRKAGMAEIATGVLHNVGNVLNSVNVSSSLVADGLRKSKLPRLASVATMLKDHEADVGAFVSQDPKGKLIPAYLGQLAQHLGEEQASILKELSHLQKNVEHIKEIVTTQQTYASGAGLIEPVNVCGLLQDALRINDASLARHGIEVVKHFYEIPKVCADKHKVLQILVNLIRNARDAMRDRPTKILTLKIKRVENAVRVQIADTGCGIPAENLTRIFAHGFTTKQDGHGFGLHSSANAAREMKGTLTVESDGIGQGATFTLELPAEGAGCPIDS
jgi:signal transduction histidine kinase